MQIRDINPLDVLGIRQVSFLPDHFSSANFVFSTYTAHDISAWIKNNTRGKYHISQALVLGGDNMLFPGYCVGFENPKEYMFFLMACPHIK